jgi:5-methylcytosine-specific restriction endonuclease McrA
MTISQHRRAAIYIRDGHQCVRCGCKNGLTIDHIIPKAAGGTDGIENLQTLCEDCNQAKGDGYMQYRPYFERFLPQSKND